MKTLTACSLFAAGYCLANAIDAAVDGRAFWTLAWTLVFAATAVAVALAEKWEARR